MNQFGEIREIGAPRLARDKDFSCALNRFPDFEIG